MRSGKEKTKWIIGTILLVSIVLFPCLKTEDTKIPEQSIEEVAKIETAKETVLEETKPLTPEPKEVVNEKLPKPEEVRGVWFSYHEWQELPWEEEAFCEAVDEVMNNLEKWGMNTIYVHVRADADAMYPSKIFPWSSYITGEQGKDPGYDPFAYFVEAAHQKGIRIHAWINPYRVTHDDCTWEEVCKENPAYVWFNDDDAKLNRRVLSYNGKYFFNPASVDVRKLICAGVKELLENYEIDGIHLDDYFYPTISSSDEPSFDEAEYRVYSGDLSLPDWRRENVNLLVRQLYETVKSYDSQIEFGISPAGNIDNLISDNQYYVDIETWLSETGYVDYIIPQLFWGFEARRKDGSLAPWAYEGNLNRWLSLKEEDSIDLYIGLPMYLAGTDVYDGNETSEWMAHDDILARQVQCAKDSNTVSGFVFYAYSSFLEETSLSEKENLLQEFR